MVLRIFEKNTPREGAAEGIVSSGCAVFVVSAGITSQFLSASNGKFFSTGRCSFLIVRFRHPECSTNTPENSFDLFIGMTRKKL